MSDQNSGGMVNLGGLWPSTSKAGVRYLSGRFGLGGKLMVYPIKEPREGGPTHKILLTEWVESAGAGASVKPDDDDIPF